MKKTKKIFLFAQKHVAKNMKFLSEYLKAEAKLKNMKSQECYDKSSGKSSLFTFIFCHLFYCFMFYLFIYLFIHLFVYLLLVFNQNFFLVEKIQRFPKKFTALTF